ncbi:SGNH hydrolase-type protein [Rhizobium phage RHph_Y25]|nr:SGNH hydrolase-type protein [Rhizobium phage RHph_Y25]
MSLMLGLSLSLNNQLGGGGGGGQTGTLRNVATRNLLPSTSTSGVKSARGRTQMFARDTISSAQFVFPNWLVAQIGGTGPYTEQANLGSITIQAAVEYPVGTTTAILFSGSTTGTIAAGDNLVSDALSISIPADAKFAVRWRINGASGLCYVSATTPAVTSASFGDAFDSSATVNALADNTTNTADAYTNNAIGACYGPIAVLSVSNKESVIAYGTSITHGENDTLDATLDLGIVARGVGMTSGYINCGVRGDSAYRAVNVLGTSNFAKRAALALYATRAIIEYGANDVGTVEARTAAQCLADRATMYAYIKSVAPSIRIYQTTTTPLAASTDSFATTTNQTADATITPKLTSINDAVRAGGIANLDGYYDVSDVVCTARNSGIWKCPASYTPMTSGGGLHPLQAGYRYVRDLGLFQIAATGQTIGLVANRAQVPTNVQNIAANTTARRAHWSHASGEISHIQAVDVGWYLSRSTWLPTAGGSHTIKKYIEYPAGTFHQVTWAAATTLAKSSTSVAKSDVIISSVTGLPLRIPADTQFWERTVVTVGSATTPVIELPANNDTLGVDDGTDLTDKGNSGTITPTAAIWTFGSQGFVGRVGAANAQSVVALGDSLIFAQGDITNVGTKQGSGWFGRLCDNEGVPYVKIAVPGGKAQNFAQNAFIVHGGNLINQLAFSHVICELGLNDLAVASRTAAQILADLQTVYAIIPAAAQLWQTTITTRTDSTSGNYTSVADQTVKTDGNMADLTPLNTSIRAGTANVDFVLDVADAEMSARDSNIHGGPFPPVLDGTHFTSTKAAAIASALSL